jgi:hypothetical protein
MVSARRRVGGLVAGVSALVGVVLLLVEVPQPPKGVMASDRSDQIPLPMKQWVALEMPQVGKGPSANIKHLTAAVNPENGRIYMVGGDYAGLRFENSYRQEVWSLSVAERWTNRADRNAGWQLEYPYCGPPGAVQPKHPDFVGWLWDVRRRVFWMVPGTMVASNDVCEGETVAAGSDPGFLFYRVMTFDPASRQWADRGSPGPDTGETWMSVHDTVRDELVRFGYSGGSGAVVNILKLRTMEWERVRLATNALGKEIRISKEYLAADHARRVIYAIDGVSGRLHRYSMERRNIEDLGPVPGGPHGSENYMYVVWDSRNEVLLWYRESPPSFHAYHPRSMRWEPLSVSSDLPNVVARGRVMVYDPLQNATLLFGGVEPANPYLFLYRYAEKSAR